MSDESMSLWLSKMQHDYPSVFQFMRNFGWTEQWRPDPETLQREPWWAGEFPRHTQASYFLSCFSGLRCRPGREWPGVQFGCQRVDLCRTLRVVQPYDVEAHFLREKPPWTRPAAFPIGTMNETMMFMREDWVTIEVGAHFRVAIVYEDPFACIANKMKGYGKSWPPSGRLIELEQDYIDGRVVEVDGTFVWEALPDYLVELTTLG
jgi:hypothetical protein